ncbi:SRPBCC family protein [Nocardioides sp. SOB77]|uniref:SRPBCC family protein n=1 Tax=Nocardioides oceani TaxID=3058369 RepID=A0ABT8FD31_9ACTN|nr:SRPBCC family protein [Nocardioides oceani]MDN4172355.1 SRPBCC family protein [Nocardioides oceani]
MQLLNEFEVALPPEQTWTLLTDLEKVAPCLPGASITSVDGEDYHGRAKIKVGPITAEYKGVAQFTEMDASAHRAVLLARGKDARGQGDATATVTATLSPEGTGTKVTVETDLALTGKVAQFGRGVLADVSGALMGLFADRLQEMVLAEGGTPNAAPAHQAPASAPAAAPQPQPAGAASATTLTPPRGRDDDEVLDVLALAGGMPWSKAIPAGGTLVSILAALISVFAAGYASARARSAGN